MNLVVKMMNLVVKMMNFDFHRTKWPQVAACTVSRGQSRVRCLPRTRHAARVSRMHRHSQTRSGLHGRSTGRRSVHAGFLLYCFRAVVVVLKRIDFLAQQQVLTKKVLTKN